MNRAFWRNWHRWIGFPASLFLMFAAVTGVWVACTEFFGEEEAQREATRDLVSTVKTNGAGGVWSGPVALAFQSAALSYPRAPVDKFTVQFRGEPPTVTIYIGKPAGGEDRKLTYNARDAKLIANESYSDKPLINRIHSGEWFGDGGLVVAMFWGLSLAILTLSGLVVYFQMRRKDAVRLKRFFW